MIELNRPEVWGFFWGGIAASLAFGADMARRLLVGAVVGGMAWLLLGVADPRVLPALPVWNHYLSVLIAIPLLTALCVGVLAPSPAQVRRLVRGALFIQSALVVALLRAPLDVGWHYRVAYDWVPEFGVRIHLALDGISAWLVAALTWTSFASVASRGVWQSRRFRIVAAALLIGQAATLLALTSLDLMGFLLAWELSALCAALLVAAEHRTHFSRAAVRAWFGTLPFGLGVGLVVVYLAAVHRDIAGYWSFDYIALRRLVLPEWERWTCYVLVLVAVLGRLGFWPFGRGISRLLFLCRPWAAPFVFASSACVGWVAYLRLCTGLLDGPTWTAGATLVWVFLFLGVLPPLVAMWRSRSAGRALVYGALAQLPFGLVGVTAATRSGITGALVLLCSQIFAFAGLGLILHGQEHSFLGSARKARLPTGPAAWVATVCLGSLTSLPLSGGFSGIVAIASATLVATPLGVWARGQGPAMCLALLASGVVSYCVLRGVGPSRRRERSPFGLVHVFLAGWVLVLGVVPGWLVNHAWNAATEVEERYVEGRVAYQGADPSAAGLRPRRGGPLEVGYPAPPTGVSLP